MRPLLVVALAVSSLASAQVVPWATETSSVGSTQAGDPAVVVDAAELVLGTDYTQNGLYVWTPDSGFPVQQLSLGVLRSVDWQPGLVAVASANGLLSFFAVTPAGLQARDPATFNAVSPGTVSLLPAADAGYEAWYDTSSPTLHHVAIEVALDGRLTFTQLPNVDVPENPSGLAVDERTGRVYVGQPSLGLLAIEADGGRELLVSIDAGTLGSTVGGVSLFHALSGSVFVFTTSPLTDTVHVHAISGAQVTWQGTFSVGEPDGGAVRVRSPRFLDVQERPLTGFPLGVLALQDGLLGNYKLVDLREVDRAVPLPPALYGSATLPDGGAPDAGADAGAGGVIVGTGGGSGKSPDDGGGSTRPPLTDGCSCTSSPLALLPAVLLLWWIRRFRS